MTKELKVYLALAVTVGFWASAFVGIRIGLEGYTPGPLAFFRFIIASSILSIINLKLKQTAVMPLMTKLKLLFIGIGGIGVYNLSLNYGEQTVSAGVASFIIGQIPVLTMIISIFVLKEELSKKVWLGVLFSFFGLVLIAWGESHQAGQLQGMLLIMVAVVMGALYTLTQKSFLKAYHPVTITTWIMWGGTLMLFWYLPDFVREWPNASISVNIAAIYMGIFPAALAYVAWCYVLDHMPASRASIYLYGMPIISTIMGYFLLHETPKALSLIGGLVALFGAILAGYYMRNESSSITSSRTK